MVIISTVFPLNVLVAQVHSTGTGWIALRKRSCCLAEVGRRFFSTPFSCVVMVIVSDLVNIDHRDGKDRTVEEGNRGPSNR